MDIETIKVELKKILNNYDFFKICTCKNKKSQRTIVINLTKKVIENKRTNDNKFFSWLIPEEKQSATHYYFVITNNFTTLMATSKFENILPNLNNEELKTIYFLLTQTLIDGL